MSDSHLYLHLKWMVSGG